MSPTPNVVDVRMGWSYIRRVSSLLGLNVRSSSSIHDHTTSIDDHIASIYYKSNTDFVDIEAGDSTLLGGIGEETDAHGAGGDLAVLTNGGQSIKSAFYDDSPRSSEDSHNAERFDTMARNSMSSLQQRRQSSSSAFTTEPLTAITNDRNWSWRYLRERFRIKELEDLFEQYQQRLHHAMFIVYLFLQLTISCVFITALLSSQSPKEQVVPEVTGHGAIIMVSLVMLVYVYSENTFRQFPSLHIVMSGLVVVTVFATDFALTFYFHDNEVNGGQHTAVKFGNMVYLLLVVYVFLPIPRKWQVILMAVLLTLGYLALGCYAISSSNTRYVITKMCVEAMVLVCVNLVGVYWRFMSEVAFRRAFLDKRGNLESKLKLDAEKQQEENLLLSVLPKNIMQQVKAAFRESILKSQNTRISPITKKNPFPNLYITRHKMVSILYADIVNFTPLTTKLSEKDLVEMLNDLFGKFDYAAESHDCLRIKILGDCYYCVSGVPEFVTDHAHNCLKVGLEMIDIIRDVREDRGVQVDMRIGIHSGSVLSGLIGVRKWQFDVWSNDVTIANHMEQTGVAGRVHVTQNTRELLYGLDYEFEPTDAQQNDQLLQEEGIETFLIIPKKKIVSNRKVSYCQPVSVNPRITQPIDQSELKNFYEGDIAKTMASSVQYPQGVARGSILHRRRSTHTEGSSSLSSKRRTVVTDNALANFQRIMVDSKKIMEEAIEKMPLRKSDQWFHPEGIHPLVLFFTKEKWEADLLKQADPLFKYYILSALLIFTSVFIIQEVLMPENTLGWRCGVVCVASLAIVASLAWVSTIHQHHVDPHNDSEYETTNRYAITNFFYDAYMTIVTSIGMRIVLFLFICSLLYICALVNLRECKTLIAEAVLPTSEAVLPTSEAVLPTSERPLTATVSTYLYLPSNFSSTSGSKDSIPLLCCDPWNFTYSYTLVLLVTWSFFRMHFLIKFAVYVIAVAAYAGIVLNAAEEVYNHAQLSDVCPPPTVSSVGLGEEMCHVLFICTILLALHVTDREMEYIARLDFQWKQQLQKEQDEAHTTYTANKLLLENLLPYHVAYFFLNRQTNLDELYHESYQHVSVIFASIPSYAEFYRENVNINDGTTCLSVLNEIISDFDMLTYLQPFKAIEKIKVVGSTYMAACGLQPGRKYSDENSFKERNKRENVSTITKFAVAMMKRLEKMNGENQQNFKLRVGIDVGPLIAGVVGANKPMYDIWGNTVNVASRMDYTGEMGMIHTTPEVGEILQELGWSVHCRGEIFVKGKGRMTTYFVDPRSVPCEPEVFAPNNDNIPAPDPLDINERRRSSQLSVSSLMGLLSSQRGSLDINTGKDEEDTHSNQSFPIYRLITDGEETLLQTNDKELETAAMDSPYSLDSRTETHEKLENISTLPPSGSN